MCCNRLISQLKLLTKTCVDSFEKAALRIFLKKEKYVGL